MLGGRIRSEGDVYHVMARGVGRQIIFEDRSDRNYFLEQMERFLEKQRETEHPVTVFAWCLMTNHFHMLLRANPQDMAAFLHDLMGLYARYFNIRHDRVGTLFQGRFGSVPIADDAQFLTVLRYIHQNPLEAGEPLTSRWSSYREYLGEPVFTETSFGLDMLGGRDAFIAFHQTDGMSSAVAGELRLPAFEETETEKLRKAESLVKPYSIYELRDLPKPVRNEKLRALKQAGLSVREIERFTGIGRNIIQRT